MPRRSAGVLLHRMGADGLEVLLVHPGGPFWRRKDVGAWQIPKGEIEDGEDAEAAARREVEEELGFAVNVALVPLGEVRQAGGKLVVAFAADMDVDADAIVSGTVEIEWPRGSGRRQSIPEVDAARWLPPHEARRLMLPSQLPLIDLLETVLERARADRDPARPTVGTDAASLRRVARRRDMPNGNDLPTPSDDFIESQAEPQLGQAVDAGQSAAAIHAIEKAQDVQHSGSGLSTDEQSSLDAERAKD